MLADIAVANETTDSAPGMETWYVAPTDFYGIAADGVVGEVMFPNTVPPFYPSAFHVSPTPRPDQYTNWQAGIRAHNRWLAEFCAQEPARRAGIGLIHLNDLDAAVEEALSERERPAGPAGESWDAEDDEANRVRLPRLAALFLD